MFTETSSGIHALFLTRPVAWVVVGLFDRVSHVSYFLLQVCSGLEPPGPGESEWLYRLCCHVQVRNSEVTVSLPD